MVIPLHRAVCASLVACCSDFVNPDVETLDWRAVCGRTARTVRRAGTARAVPDPYHTALNKAYYADICRGEHHRNWHRQGFYDGLVK